MSCLRVPLLRPTASSGWLMTDCCLMTTTGAESLPVQCSTLKRYTHTHTHTHTHHTAHCSTLKRYTHTHTHKHTPNTHTHTHTHTHSHKHTHGCALPVVDHRF